MGAKRTDYYWTEEPEPHIGRRRAILKDHRDQKALRNQSLDEIFSIDFG